MDLPLDLTFVFTGARRAPGRGAADSGEVTPLKWPPRASKINSGAAWQ